MKIPLSWVKDFVEVELAVEELAHRLTLAGLEVEAVRYVGLPLPQGKTEGRSGGHPTPETKVSGIHWEPDKIVVGAIDEVVPHPNADRLVLCRLRDGEGEHTVLTGAPNLFPYLEQGPLDPPLKVAYAREGARLYDGHQPGWEMMTLKPTTIRGVESSSMVCSEKELGISEDHEGVIILDQEAPVGTPLVDYMGDAVLDIAITPNIARDANVLGVAREIAALTGTPLQNPSYEVEWNGPPVEDLAAIEIRDPDLNPRFVLGFIDQVEVGSSPYWVQRRLRLAGMRPINSIVDATNYVMLEIGEPLHAFDYDVLVERAGGEAPTIITRLPMPGEVLTTLDDVDRQLDDFTVLVADTKGPLSIAGVMGGEESEVSDDTTRVLLEGAAWNYINIRRTVASQRMQTEASYRFERGVHPAIAERGVRRGLELLRRITGGRVAQGLVDAYPNPLQDPQVELSQKDVRRWLGIDLSAEEIASILERLEFQVQVQGDRVQARTPDHRLDIGSGMTGKADLMEEVARIYGYDAIPETQISDTIPPQYGSSRLDKEERIRDLLIRLGLQEIISYRMTSEGREADLLLGQALEGEYVRLANPSTSDRDVLRRTLLGGLMEAVARNARVVDRLAFFEIGPVFHPEAKAELPREINRLGILLSGPRRSSDWVEGEVPDMDFFDLKGLLERLFDGLHLPTAAYEPTEHPTFHPGKCASVRLGDQAVGVMGEMHPLVVEKHKTLGSSLLFAELDLDPILDMVPDRHPVEPVPAYPPVLEDLAVVVEESVPAAEVAYLIRRAGGEWVKEVRLFDLYRGQQIGEGRKSLAYSVVYQAPDRTLTDEEVAGRREEIIKALKEEWGARIRDQ